MTISNNSTGLRPGVCTFATRPVSPYTGQVIYETDTKLVKVWDGSAWSSIAGANYDVRLAYQSTTGGYGVTSTTVAGASNIFSSNLTWVANGTSTYWIEFYCPFQYTGYTGTGNYNQVLLVDSSGTNIGTIAMTEKNNVTTERAYGNISVKFPYTPAAGSASINVRAIYVGGDNTGGLAAGSGTGGAYMPMWCAVYGPALT